MENPEAVLQTIRKMTTLLEYKTNLIIIIILNQSLQVKQIEGCVLFGPKISRGFLTKDSG